MIKIEHLVKKYGDRYAVNDISFEVHPGEIVGFLGPNGAGKTTTMNILTGYLSSTSGRAMIDGMDILEHPMEVKKKIGFLPEQPPLYMEMTPYEYLGFIYDLKKCTLNKKEHLDEICEVVKISDVKNRMIKNLSKGYKQRVGIAGAIVGNPEVVIFDEPTNGLDPKQIIDIRNLISNLGKKHTVILSNSDHKRRQDCRRRKDGEYRECHQEPQDFHPCGRSLRLGALGSEKDKRRPLCQDSGDI